MHYDYPVIYVHDLFLFCSSVGAVGSSGALSFGSACITQTKHLRTTRWQTDGHGQTDPVFPGPGITGVLVGITVVLVSLQLSVNGETSSVQQTCDISVKRVGDCLFALLKCYYLRWCINWFLSAICWLF